METIFVNHCTYDYKKYLELKKTLLKSILKTGYVLCAISIVFFIIGFHFKLGLLQAIGILGFLFFAFRSFISPMFLAKNDVKRDQKTYQGHNMETIINFYEDHLLAVNAISGSKTKINYDEIFNIRTSKSLFIIEMDQNLVLLVDKNGFEKGNAVEFQKFIDQTFERTTEE